MKSTAYYATPLGLIGITECDGAITNLFFSKEKQSKDDTQAETPLLKEASRQVTEYFAGARKYFDLPLGAEGTEFQKSVWKALRDIPYGETRSYKQVAQMIGQPGSSRAVGMANNKNPLLILTPCHRVIGWDGKLVGYAGGLHIKEQLLDLEKAL